MFISFIVMRGLRITSEADDDEKGWMSIDMRTIKRLKGVWWMPWHREAMKDVVRCDKLRGAANRL